MEHMTRNCDILTSNYSEKNLLKPAIIKSEIIVLLENEMDWQCCPFTIRALEYKARVIENLRFKIQDRELF